MTTKTVTATFRIEEDAFKDLQEDAKRQNISVNTLVNQLFLSYSHYDRLMKRFHVMKVPAATFKTILDGSSDEAVIAAAKTAGESIAKTFVIAKTGAVHAGEHLGRLQDLGQLHQRVRVQRVPRPWEDHDNPDPQPGQEGEPVPEGVGGLPVRAASTRPPNSWWTTTP